MSQIFTACLSAGEIERSRGGMKECSNVVVWRRKAADALERPKEKGRSPWMALSKSGC